MKKTYDVEREFRDLIWHLDRGRDRATGKRLARHSDNWDRKGDVCHLRPRSLAPELKFSEHNAFLMCRRLHIASDARGNYRLKILGTDARQPLTFRMTDRNGAVLWERVG